MYTKAVIPYKPSSSANLLVYMNQKVIYVHSRSSTMHTKDSTNYTEKKKHSQVVSQTPSWLGRHHLS